MEGQSQENAMRRAPVDPTRRFLYNGVNLSQRRREE